MNDYFYLRNKKSKELVTRITQHGGGAMLHRAMGIEKASDCSDFTVWNNFYDIYVYFWDLLHYQLLSVWQNDDHILTFENYKKFTSLLDSDIHDIEIRYYNQRYNLDTSVAPIEIDFVKLSKLFNLSIINHPKNLPGYMSYINTLPVIVTKHYEYCVDIYPLKYADIKDYITENIRCIQPNFAESYILVNEDDLNFLKLIFDNLRDAKYYKVEDVTGYLKLFRSVYRNAKEVKDTLNAQRRSLSTRRNKNLYKRSFES